MIGTCPQCGGDSIGPAGAGVLCDDCGWKSGKARQQSETERRFVCPACGADNFVEGKDGTLYCGRMRCKWHGTWAEVEGGEREAITPDDDPVVEVKMVPASQLEAAEQRAERLTATLAKVRRTIKQAIDFAVADINEALAQGDQLSGKSRQDKPASG